MPERGRWAPALVLVLVCAAGPATADIISLTGNLILGVSTGNVAQLTANGLGIGVASPSANLHVAGNAVVSGALAVGGTTNASGSNLHINGTLGFSIQAVSSNTTLSSNTVVLADTSSGNLNLWLPSASSVPGRMYRIKKATNSNTLSVGAASGNMDGFHTLALTSGGNGYPYATLVSGGGNWQVLEMGGATLSNYAGDAEVAAYIAAVEATDGQALEDGVKAALATFVAGCKSDGVWDAVKAACILAGARTLSGALVPLKGSAPTNHNFTSGDYNRETGLLGNATSKYLDTNRAGNADPQNSFHASVYGTTLDSAIWMGSSDTTVLMVKNVGLFHLNTEGYYFNARIDLAGSNASTFNNGYGVPALQNGFVGTTRNNGTTITGRARSTTYTCNTPGSSKAPSSDTYFVYTSNNSGTPTSPFPWWSAARLAWYSLGTDLDLSKLEARLSTLMTDLGAAIP